MSGDSATHKKRERESALKETQPKPTSAPIWMDGALMSVSFSSVPVRVLTKVVTTG